MQGRSDSAGARRIRRRREGGGAQAVAHAGERAAAGRRRRRGAPWRRRVRRRRRSGGKGSRTPMVREGRSPDRRAAARYAYVLADAGTGFGSTVDTVSTRQTIITLISASGECG